MQQHNFGVHKQDIYFVNYNNAIDAKVSIMIFVSQYFDPLFEDWTIIKPPEAETKIQLYLYQPFNQPNYALPIENNLIKIIPCPNGQSTSYSKIISYIQCDQNNINRIGYWVYDRFGQVPLPTLSREGHFGPLSGIRFINNKHNYIRAILNWEYISWFGYNNAFSTTVSKILGSIQTFSTVLPSHSMSTMTSKLFQKHLCNTSQNHLLSCQALPVGSNCSGYVKRYHLKQATRQNRLGTSLQRWQIVFAYHGNG